MALLDRFRSAVDGLGGGEVVGDHATPSAVTSLPNTRKNSRINFTTDLGGGEVVGDHATPSALTSLPNTRKNSRINFTTDAAWALVPITEMDSCAILSVL